MGFERLGATAAARVDRDMQVWGKTEHPSHAPSGSDPATGSGCADQPAPTAAASPAQDCAAAWARITERLREDFGEDIYRSWFRGLCLEDVSGMTVVLSVPTAFLRMWIRTNYGTQLLALWRAECPQVERVDVRVRSIGNGQATARNEHGAQKAPQAASGQRDAGAAGTPEGAASGPAPTQGEPALESAPLDPRFRFDSFAVGQSNKIAHDTAMAVASANGEAAAMFNPLFIHGGVGRGKTHLLHAIAWRAAEISPGRRILHLSAEQFVFRFVSAVRSDSAIDFKEKLRKIDLLLIDDLQFLQGKATHREFGHTVNALIESCRQVVLVADRPPSDLEGFDARTCSRLAGGLVVGVGAQEVELRRQILQARVAALGERGQAVELPEEVIDFVARNVASSGRDLEGALNRLVAYHCYAGLPVTVDLAERVIRDLVSNQERPQVRIEDIQRVVAAHYQVSRSDLVSSRRTRSIVVPRQVAMYLAKSLTPRSLPEIGRRFGNRDHTTVLHAVRKIEGLVVQDEGLAKDIDGLKRRLEDGEG